MELGELPPPALPPTDVGPEVDFADVPSADDSAVLDPVWLAHRRSSGLPPTYLPAAMPGPRARRPGSRLVALALVVMFLAATAAGICLTYGPPNLHP